MDKKQGQHLRLGDTAPDFTAETTMGRINFYDYIGQSWCLLFSHPKDFTPVCTTELGEAAKRREEFVKRNTKMIALSVDDLPSHMRWIDDINETQNTELNYPIISDPEREIATLYDMIHPNADDTFTVRSLFIIDPEKKVRLIITYPASTGRSFEEILRVIDSLQLTDRCAVATPVNWKNGDECVILPSIIDKKILDEKFPERREIKPYLRLTPQPSHSEK